MTMKKIFSHVVHEIRSTHIHGFEQSELDVSVNSNFLYLYLSHTPMVTYQLSCNTVP